MATDWVYEESQLTTEEMIWFETWLTTIAREDVMDFRFATECADECLKQFKERFRKKNENNIRSIPSNS